MPQNTLQEWIEQSPEHVAAFRILLGERGDMNTASVVALEPSMDRRFPRHSVIDAEDFMHAAELVESAAEAGGWRTEHPTCRVVSLDENAKPVSSWQRTSSMRLDEEQVTDPVSAMAKELIAMAAETRRSLAVVVTTMAEMSERHDTAIADMIDTNRDLAETASELELVATVAELEEEARAGQEGDPMEQAAAAALEQVTGVFLGHRPELTPGQAKTLLTTRPELLRDLVADQEVVQLFVGAMTDLSSQVATPTEPPEVLEAELEPAPAGDEKA